MKSITIINPAAGGDRVEEVSPHIKGRLARIADALIGPTKGFLFDSVR